MPVCFEPTGCSAYCFIEPMKTDYSVIIADDHSLIADGIAAVIQQYTSYNVLATVKTGKALLKLLNTKKPDMILLDINMPEMDGIETALQVKQLNKGIKVVLISMHWDLAIKNAIKKTSADGFIPKLTSAAEFIEALQKIVNGEKLFITGNSNTRVKRSSDFMARTRLSERELEVIRYIKKGHTSKEIAALMHLSSYTIDTHRKNICRKLNLSSPNALLKFVHETNL